MKNICVSRPDDASVFVRFFPFQPDADLFLPVAVGHLLHLIVAQRFDEQRQLGKAVVTHIKIRQPLGQLIPQLSRGHPAVLIGKFLQNSIDGTTDPADIPPLPAIFLLSAAGFRLLAAVFGLPQLLCLFLLLLVCIEKIQVT